MNERSIRLNPWPHNINTKTAHVLRTVKNVCTINRKQGIRELCTPQYLGEINNYTGLDLGLAVSSMKNHTSNEGWELFKALECNNYTLCGKELEIPHTDLREILSIVNAPRTIVLQDKREWEWKTAAGNKVKFDDEERYKNVELLAKRNDIFTLTVLKDAQNNPRYHASSAHEIGAHAWIVYYHPDIVKSVAPYTRHRHLIRTYHTIDPETVPPYSSNTRKGIVVSGAIGNAYPLRTFVVRSVQTGRLTGIDILKHPGYHRSGSHTPKYLQTLSQYKVAICTSSRYGYALRKIVEAAACGCIVLTDLPVDDVLPEIDGSLVRVPSTITPKQLQRMLDELVGAYDPYKQSQYAEAAKGFYDYRAMGKRLVTDIETLRRNYK